MINMTARECADEVDAWFQRERVVGSSALRDRIEAAILVHEAEVLRKVDGILYAMTVDPDDDVVSHPVEYVQWRENILQEARQRVLALLPPPPEVKP